MNNKKKTPTIKTNAFKKERVFKDFKDLDIQIRTIEKKINEDIDKDIYYIVEIGLFESMGERGLILTEFYTEYPQEKEILKDVLTYLKDIKEEYEDKLLSYYEEEYLKILNRIMPSLKNIERGFKKNA